MRLLHRVPVTVDGAPGATRTVVLNRSPGEEVSEALRAAEVRFTRFFNNTPIAIAAIDRLGRIGRTNAPFLRMFAGRAAGRHAARSSIWSPTRTRPNLAAALAAGRGGRRRDPADRRDARRRGPALAAASSSTRSPKGAGGSEMVIVNVIDITEQRALEQQVAPAARRWSRSASSPAASRTTSTTC